MSFSSLSSRSVSCAAVATALALGAARALVACGGDTVNSDLFTDGGAGSTDATVGALDAGDAADATGDDANGDDAAEPSDGSTSDAGDEADADTGDRGDGAATCVVGAACAIDGQAGGLCAAAIDGGTPSCQPCSGTGNASDATCTAAYGGTSNSYICASGQCVPGNCHADTDCTAGQICGLSTANTCGACSTDSQCAGDPSYGASYVCSGGACVTSACTSLATSRATTCAGTGVTGDVCCPNLPGSTTGTCVDGTCCVTADCNQNGTSGQTCIGHTCTTCAAATGNVYNVDPINGSDDGTTGASGTCAFKTITHALAFLGANPVLGTVVKVTAATLDASEAYPIAVPKNVTISGAVDGTSNAATTVVDVPAGKVGFLMTASPSVLSNLHIDGQMSGTSAVDVGTGSSLTTVIANVQIANTAGAGIHVGTTPGQTSGGVVTITAGTSVTAAGSAAAPASGLLVAGAGQAIVVGSAQYPVTFSGNTRHGIEVTDAAYVTINGALGATPPSTASVQALANERAGIAITQTPSTTLLGNARSNITGIAAGNSTAGNGFRFNAGSNVHVRSSWALGNSGSGVAVLTYNAGASNDVSKIDLGTVGDPGKNTLQAVTTPNLGTGICLALQGNTNQTLNAAGNTFVTAGTNPTSTDCSALTGAGTISSSTTAACTGGADIGFTTGESGVAVSVNNCTIQ